MSSWEESREGRERRSKELKEKFGDNIDPEKINKHILDNIDDYPAEVGFIASCYANYLTLQNLDKIKELIELCKVEIFDIKEVTKKIKPTSTGIKVDGFVECKDVKATF